MSSRSDDDALFAVFVIVAIPLGFITFKFSNAIGVPWEIGLQIILKMITVLAIWGAWKYFSNYSSFAVWPIAIAGLCWAWFPALEIWAIENNSNAVLPNVSERYSTVTVAWFGQWYAKFIIISAVLGCGYFIDHKLK